jgi:solute:Na+ symporter, SSS family
MIFGNFYGYMSWLGTQGFYCSARTPHEQKMGNIIGGWRLVPQSLITILLPIAGYTVMYLTTHAALAAQVNAKLATIPNPAVKDMMTTPIAMSYFLPFGIKGLLATTMLFFSFTCHDTYMHSWGSIFVQDVWIPLRKKMRSPQQHIKMLRYSIIFVGVFGFLFSLYYPMSSKIYMFFAITGTISGAGAGAVIIGGLYWKKGTTWAAYASLISGAIIGTAGVLFYPWYKLHYGKDFFINEQWMSMIAMIIAIAIYYFGSLATRKKEQDFNMDRMLNRGEYAIASEHEYQMTKPNRAEQIFGITKEFSKPDKVLAIGLVLYNLLWFTILVVVTIWNWFKPVGNEWFINFWYWYILQLLVLSIPVTIWFQIGGIMDVKALYKTLADAQRDHTDDGRVTVHSDDEHSV